MSSNAEKALALKQALGVILFGGLGALVFYQSERISRSVGTALCFFLFGFAGLGLFKLVGTIGRIMNRRDEP